MGPGVANESSRALLDEFGSLDAILAGSHLRQMRASGGNRLVSNRLRAFRSAMTHCLRTRAYADLSLSNWAALHDYLRIDMGQATTESFRVLFLDIRNRLICDDVMWRGTIDRVDVHIREIVARALECGAAAMIIVHNHPGGNPTPSSADLSVTRTLALAGQYVRIAVHDHIVVSRNGCASMRAAGLL